MKYVRDKDTGEVCELDFDSREGVFIVVSYNDATGITKKTTYDNLDDLTKYWEDYEEPKGYWYYDTTCGRVEKLDHNEDKEIDSSIGNCFETREEAEKAVEKLKAFKRLKDGGFGFVELRAPNYGSSDIITIKACCPWTSKNIDDLRICFGGEE